MMNATSPNSDGDPSAGQRFIGGRSPGEGARQPVAVIRPLGAGGDHLCSLPILRALGAGRPVGMVHFDAHSDLWDNYFGGFKLAHRTPFCRAIEEGVLGPRRTIQIGLRGSVCDLEDRAFGSKHGVRMMDIEEAADHGPAKVIEIARAVVGDGPTYVSFDIDCLDPAFARGRKRQRSAASPRARRKACCAASPGSISSGPTWWKCRRPSIRRATPPSTAPP